MDPTQYNLVYNQNQLFQNGNFVYIQKRFTLAAGRMLADVQNRLQATGDGLNCFTLVQPAGKNHPTWLLGRNCYLSLCISGLL